MDRDVLVDRLRRALAERSDIACAYLFGSRARDRGVREGVRDPLAPSPSAKIFAPSDVDVAVLWSLPPSDPLAAAGLVLADELGELLHRDVQVVILDRVSPELAHFVRLDGILLAENDKKARVRFEVASRRDYFDVLPHLHRYRRHEARP